MTPDELDAIEARANAATHGPWESLNDGDRIVAWRREDDAIGVREFDYVVPEPMDSAADAEFIAHARTDVPALIAALRDALAENDRIAAMVEWLAEVIVDARDACQRAESIEPSGSPEWVESGIAMRTTVLREVRQVLDRERTAHPSALDRVTRERDEAIRHKVELDDLRRQVKAERDEARVSEATYLRLAQAAGAQKDRVEAAMTTVTRERDEARAAIARVRALCDEWGKDGPVEWTAPDAAQYVRAALDGEGR